MKKTIAIFAACSLMLTGSACGAATDPAESSIGNETSISATNAVASDALELLTKVWDTYAEADRFPAAGGDFTEEHMTIDAPGAYDLTDLEQLDSTLGVPADAAPNIDDAASLVHMMNGNTFTCGAFHAVTPEQTETVAAAIQKNLQSRQWVCGMPEVLRIVQIGDYVVSVFGTQELADTFQEKLMAAYPEAAVYCDEPITLS